MIYKIDLSIHNYVSKRSTSATLIVLILLNGSQVARILNTRTTKNTMPKRCGSKEMGKWLT